MKTKSPDLRSRLSLIDTRFGISNLDLVKDIAEIAFEEPRLLQLDGEVLESYREIRVEIIKGAVGLLTNKNNIYL